jgi:subtilisin-like proprotein convertase family protein
MIYRPELKSPLSNNGESAINIPRRGQPIRFLEHVTATVSMNYTDFRGKIEITLVSPSGMINTMATRKVTDRQTINNVIYFIQMLASINTPKVQAPFGVSLL